MFAALPYPSMESVSGLHNSGPASFGRRPTVVKSIMGYGNATNMSKTLAKTYTLVCAYCQFDPVPSRSPLELFV